MVKLANCVIVNVLIAASGIAVSSFAVATSLSA